MAYLENTDFKSAIEKIHKIKGLNNYGTKSMSSDEQKHNNKPNLVKENEELYETRGSYDPSTMDAFKSASQSTYMQLGNHCMNEKLWDKLDNTPICVQRLNRSVTNISHSPGSTTKCRENIFHETSKCVMSMQNFHKTQETSQVKRISCFNPANSKLCWHLSSVHCLNTNNADATRNCKDSGEAGVQYLSDKCNCNVCKVTDTSPTNNRLLFDVVYPYEYYNKYQRSRKKVVMNQKTCSKERTLTCIDTITYDHHTPPKTTRYFNESANVLPHSLNQNGFRQNSDITLKKDTHVQCKAKNHDFIIAKDTDKEIVLKGLKGWILKKGEMCKDNIKKDIKYSLYNINGLGVKFSYPASRPYMQSSRPETCVTFRRPTEKSCSIRANTTLGNGQLNKDITVSMQEMQTTSSKRMNRLIRGYTQTPKLFSDEGN